VLEYLSLGWAISDHSIGQAGVPDQNEIIIGRPHQIRKVERPRLKIVY
jgi:hypothetical protein